VRAPRRSEAEKRLAELAGAITWDTTCLNCASLLDKSYAETARAEQAEDLLRRYIQHVDDCEGSVFLSDTYRGMSKVKFTDEEWALLLTHCGYSG
jgi:hypothetical protein